MGEMSRAKISGAGALRGREPLQCRALKDRVRILVSLGTEGVEGKSNLI